jgi:hypothetical protein
MKNIKINMRKYTNRYGNVFTFEQLENGNIQWSGNFEYCRFGFNDNDGWDDITMVDPSGGPYISLNMDMKLFGFDGKIVNGFIKNDSGYEIILEK